MARTILTRRTALVGLAAAGMPLLKGPAYGQAATDLGARTFQAGAAKLTVLSDGIMPAEGSLLAVNAPPTDVRAFLTTQGLDPNRISLGVNVTAVSLGDRSIMIDAGGGGNFMPTTGKLSDNLKRAGIDAEKVTDVVITHGHPDHIGGLLDELDDSLRFPNARHWMPAREIEFWTKTDATKYSGTIVEGMLLLAQRILKTIAPKLQSFKPETELFPGLYALDTAGHTPGHVSIRVGTGTDAVLVVADALQTHHISVTHPHWAPRGDMDADAATLVRRKLLSLAAADKARIVGYHMPFPGLGLIEAVGTAYRWSA